MPALVPVRVITDMTIRPDEMDVLEIDSLRPKPEKDILLVVGDATCLMEDLFDFKNLFRPDMTIGEFYKQKNDFDTACINHAALKFAVLEYNFEHFTSGDSHQRPMQAIAMQLPDSVIKHCWNPSSEGFNARWLRQDNRGWSGTSATLAVEMGMTMGYLKIVLAGCPMDKSGHWYDKKLSKDDNKLKNDHRNHLWFWTEMASRPMGRFIKSLSGNTADLFGKPTREWLMNT